MNFKLGIDPGISGALALIDQSTNAFVKVWDMPITAKTHGSGNEVNPYLLADVIDEAIELAGGIKTLEAHIERVGATPIQGRKQGGSSMFNFGASYGVVVGVLATKGVRTKHIPPNAWKKQMGLTGKDKDASRGQAMSLYPETSSYLVRKKDNGRADAILIAAFN